MGVRLAGQPFASRLPNGSAAIPALAFGANQDSGLYFDAANNRIAMSYDGSDVSRWDAGGLTMPTGAALTTLAALLVSAAFRVTAESVKTSTPYAVGATDAIVVMNAGAGQTANLPASPGNDQVLFIRGHANNLTVGRNGKNINGAAADLTVPAGTAVVLAYNGTEWWVVG